MDDYKDKSSSLIVFGIFEIIGGLLMSFFCLISLIPMLLPQSDQAQGQQLFSTLIIYACLAVWLITMGIGTIRGRRWARLLMLAVSWISLGVGAGAMVMITFILPKSLQSSMSKEIASVALIFILGFASLVYLLFPIIGILFYRGPNVRATFEQKDPNVSWTEKCPLPILVLIMMLALVWPTVGTMGAMNFVLPLFGTLVSGWTGAAVLLVGVGICTSLIPGVYRSRSYAWWSVMILLVLSMLSQLITYSRIDPMEFYVRAGYSGQMLDLMQKQNWATAKTFSWMALLYGLPVLFYLAVIRGYFTSGELAEKGGEKNDH